MLVSHRHKIIYFKTRKTGGTSVEVALEPFARPVGWTGTISEETAAAETEAGIVGARGPGAGDFAWRNHMSAEDIKRRLPAAVWAGYTKFAVIRNPWDKVVSFFHFAHPRLKRADPETVIATFRAWLPTADKIGEDRDCYWIGSAPVADRVLRYETLERDLGEILADLALPPVDLPRYKAKARGPRRVPYPDYYTPALVDHVGTRFDREIEHYGWSFGGTPADVRDLDGGALAAVASKSAPQRVTKGETP